MVNSNSVTFSYHLQDGDSISVYPVIESMDISNVTRLREKPLRETKFILDVHLGKLVKYLRMLGFDSLYENDYDDPEIIEIALAEKRIILTNDTGILKNGSVTHGYWVRSQKPMEQLEEIIERFDLYPGFMPFLRCMACNSIISRRTKESVIELLKSKTKQYYNEFYQCSGCNKIYWKGSHYKKMKRFIDGLMQKRVNTSALRQYPLP